MMVIWLLRYWLFDERGGKRPLSTSRASRASAASSIFSWCYSDALKFAES
ncbi:hypothetical protein CDAR_501091, partial [Caerostris darwini]